MILSENTLNVLKNFSAINNGMMFREGNVLSTISNNRTIIARAEVDDSFNRDFAIYDLPKFISVLSLFEKPEVTFGADAAKIIADKQKMTYVYADPATIVTPPTKDFNLPEPEVIVSLTASDLNHVMKASAVLQLPEIAIEGNGSVITLRALDSKNPTSDDFSIEVGNTNRKFSCIFRAENIKVMSDDYSVELNSKRISKFTNGKITYWIAMEPASSFS